MSKQNINKIEAIKTIQEKLLGKKLTYKKIYNLMNEISNKNLSDVLIAYFAASSFKEGFTPNELYYFTKAMVETGNRINFKGIVADKHSTGGVAGTRTTMIVVPIIATAGFKIPKISSRAITTPAGTADAMEVLTKVEFSPKEVKKIVNEVGGCIVWNGSLGIAPADDIIIKVEEPLSFESFDKIIVSIMAKKVAVSTNHLILDIPYGRTMKIKRLGDAKKVENKFRFLASKFKIKIKAKVTRTTEPAGFGIGPALEARDALAVLEQRENRPLALEKRALDLAGELLDMCFKDLKIKKEGLSEAKKILQSGEALKKFKKIIKAQGGDENISYDKLKIQSFPKKIYSFRYGKIISINNYNINRIARILGAPKSKYSGIYLLKKTNSEVSKKEPLMIFYSEHKYHLKEAEETIKNFPIYNIK